MKETLHHTSKNSPGYQILLPTGLYYLHVCLRCSAVILTYLSCQTTSWRLTKSWKGVTLANKDLLHTFPLRLELDICTRTYLNVLQQTLAGLQIRRIYYTGVVVSHMLKGWQKHKSDLECQYTLATNGNPAVWSRCWCWTRSCCWNLYRLDYRIMSRLWWWKTN